jgi:hypothetical protein
MSAAGRSAVSPGSASTGTSQIAVGGVVDLVRALGRCVGYGGGAHGQRGATMVISNVAVSVAPVESVTRTAKS